MSRDPIASTTIARLYIAQGHLRKAGRMLGVLLEQDPTDGAALHLRERLRLSKAPSLTAAVDAHALEIHWEGAAQLPPRHVVVASFLRVGTHPHVSVTSVGCTDAAGSCTFQRPARPGSAVVTLGFVGEHGFVAEAVTSPLVWSADDRA